jgi:hypothetical protein
MGIESTMFESRMYKPLDHAEMIVISWYLVLHYVPLHLRYSPTYAVLCPAVLKPGYSVPGLVNWMLILHHRSAAGTCQIG